MSKPNRNGVQKMISLYPPHVDFIEFVLTDKGSGSASAVIRNALDLYKEKKYPNYIFKPLSPLQQNRADKRKKETLLNNATPEQFAESIFAPVRLAVSGPQDVRAGDKVAFIYWLDDADPSPILLTKLQQFFKQWPEYLETHLTRVKTDGPLDSKVVSGKTYPSNFGFTTIL